MSLAANTHALVAAAWQGLAGLDRLLDEERDEGGWGLGDAAVVAAGTLPAAHAAPPTAPEGVAQSGRPTRSAKRRMRRLAFARALALHRC